MTALTAATAGLRQTFRPLDPMVYPLGANAIIYQDGLVAVKPDGFAAAASDTAGYRVVGLANIVDPQPIAGKLDNTGGADGAKTVQVLSNMVATFACAGMAQSNVGDTAFALDDNTVGLVAASTNGNKVGLIVRFNSATSVDVFIPPFGCNPSVATATYDATEQLQINNGLS